MTTLKSSPVISAPWWWSAVDSSVTPQLAILANELGLASAAASQRVLAVLRMMMDPHFPSATFKPLFPEVDLTAVKPWNHREALIAALQHGREVAIVAAVLEALRTFVRGSLPPLPCSRTKVRLAEDWREVFSRSKRGRDNYFLRGTHRSHAGTESGTTAYKHVLFMAVLDTCHRYDVVRTSFWTGSPANASTYEDYAAFLDGGLKSVAGDYVGVHGAWVIGHAAIRFVCLDLGVAPPAWPEALGSPPSFADLVRQLLLQFATDLPGLNLRVEELRAG